MPQTGWQQEVSKGQEYGLEAAESIRDRSIPIFSGGELPHYAGIKTFMKAPYVEDIRKVGEYDVAIVAVSHDSGTTDRPGTRFDPQGIRRISALYTSYNFELGIDLREQIKLCDVGDIFTIPANNEKSFDQISKGIAHIFSSMVAGGIHQLAHHYNPSEFDLVLVEKVGNLVCPAEFEVGEQSKIALLSLTEGKEDKVCSP